MAYPFLSKNSKAPDRPAAFGQPSAKAPAGNLAWLKGLITLVIVLTIIGGGICLIAGYTGLGPNWLSGKAAKADWQAVFLTNGQVYFGKIVKMDRDFIYLENIYYLQVVESDNTIGQAPDVQNKPEQQLRVIKLGNEIHGPTDLMKINRDQVVIIEDLKNDSRVVQAITDYLKTLAKPVK